MPRSVRTRVSVSIQIALFQSKPDPRVAQALSRPTCFRKSRVCGLTCFQECLSQMLIRSAWPPLRMEDRRSLFAAIVLRANHPGSSRRGPLRPCARASPSPHLFGILPGMVKKPVARHPRTELSLPLTCLRTASFATHRTMLHSRERLRPGWCSQTRRYANRFRTRRSRPDQASCNDS